MLLFSVAAQIAHDRSEKVRKEGEVSGAAVLALGAGRVKYDRRGEDTIESTCWTLHFGNQKHISAFFWPS
jgi:hypothetical protein